MIPGDEAPRYMQRPYDEGPSIQTAWGILRNRTNAQIESEVAQGKKPSVAILEDTDDLKVVKYENNKYLLYKVLQRVTINTLDTSNYK